MASLYLRRLKSGSVWYVKIRVAGRWRNVPTGTPDRRWAIEYGQYLEREIAAGRDPWHPKGDGVVITEAAAEYLKERSASLRPATIRSYKASLELLRECAGDIAVNGIDKATIDVLQAALRGRNRNSANIHMANIRAFLTWFRREREPSYVPPRIERIRVDRPAGIDYYSRDECGRILEAAHRVWITDRHSRPVFSFRLFIIVLMLTGMRRAEVAGLHWQPSKSDHAEWPWVDLQRGQIVVPAATAKGRRTRCVPIIADLRPTLEAWPGEHAGALFPVQMSGSGWVNRKWSDVCRLAGVPRLKLHNLRDTFAVSLLLAGVPWAVVGEILGHASVETTRRYYAAIGRDELQAAVGQVSIVDATNVLPSVTKQLFHVEHTTDS